MNSLQLLLKKRIISLNINLISYQDALGKIIEAAKCKQQSYICFANVHMIIEAYENLSFADKVNKALLVLPDGMPVVKSLRYIYGLKQDRIAGMDIFPDLLRKANDLGLNVFFFGTTDEILQRITDRVYREFPNLKVVGAFSPSFTQSLNNKEYVNLINNSEAHLVFIALGCPKQEIWMAEHSNMINSVLLGVGGAFPVFAGLVRRAPLLMRNLGLEWLYRLGQEPRRLFSRYFRTNTKFLFLLARVKIKIFFSAL